jgi:hypothetical protein
VACEGQGTGSEGEFVYDEDFQLTVIFDGGDIGDDAAEGRMDE